MNASSGSRQDAEVAEGDHMVTIPTKPLSPWHELLREIERDWIRNAASVQRDAAKVLINLIGLFCGFYAVTLSISLGAGLLNLKELGYFARIIGVGPLALWIAAMFLSFASIKPRTVKVGKGLKELQKNYQDTTRRVDRCVVSATWLFSLAVVWFAINLCLLFFRG